MQTLTFPSIHELRAPRDWALPVAMRQRLRMLQADADARDKHGKALREVEAIRALRAAAPVEEHMPDSAIRQLAELRAGLMGARIDAIAGPSDVGGLLAWLNGHVEALGARQFEFEGDRPEGDQLRGMFARARCAMWWRRQLRRAVVRLRETQAVRTGEVCATRRTPYVTHETHDRFRRRGEANRAMMAATELENSAGQVYSLADLAAKSPSSKPIRRGELMTRIRGCEDLAATTAHRGVFLTLTAPSRFHSVLRHGERNPKHDGSTPREAHEWLCSTWARARARLARIGVRFYGFRVAEPHHDGCPHWHALLWCEPGKLWRLVLNLRRWWLKDSGDEAGARRHRVKAVLMRAGGASAYIAKYIAKNIDDTGVEGHRDEAFDGPGQLDLDGGNASRVEAWASAWGIRQFQAIGQPPVTVWRELRRVVEADQRGATARLGLAFEAVNRTGTRKANWALYVAAQGGLMKGRDYLLRIATETLKREGRYETTEQPRPVGVYDVTARDTWHLSARQEWKPRGAWTRVSCPHCGWARGHDYGCPADPLGAASRTRAVHPWTRVNNCTRATVIGGRVLARGEPLRAWNAIEPGGSHTERKPPWNPPTPKPPSAPRPTPSAT